MKEKKQRVMYLGMREKYGSFSYVYVEIKDDLSLGQRLSFDCKLYSKGSVGAVYSANLEGSNINYAKKENPTYILEVKPGQGSGTSIIFKDELNLSETLNSQAEISKRNSTKPKTKTVYDIQDIRGTYKRLSTHQKSRFIADLVYQITKP